MKGSVLVTGGAKRIGKAICDALRVRGWNVLVHSRDASNPLFSDFSDRQAPERLFATTCSLAPDLCAVVNNASEFSVRGDLPEEASARLMQVNDEAPVRLTELLAEHLARQGLEGSVVNLLDVRVFGGRSCMTPYERSKRALLESTIRQARVLAPALRVNAVAPGPVLAPADSANSEKGGGILLSRRPNPEDVANAVAFLLESPAVTGQILAVDAGQSLL